MRKLSSKESRSIATSLWGKINHTYKTNTANAYCFSCEGHGGFIVAEESIPQDKKEFVEKYIQKETGILYSHSETNKSRFMHHARTRGARFSYNQTDTINYYVFEEDCAYCFAILCGINLKENPISIEDAKKSFWEWYDENNPKNIHKKMVEEKRNNGDKDLIISACGEWKTGMKNIVEVITAAGEKYLVKNYEKCFDEYNTPWLSQCEIFEYA